VERKRLARRLAIVGSLCSVAVLTVTACSSSGSSSSGSTTNAGTSSASSTAAADSGVAAARAFLAPFLQSPTTIGVSSPLTTKPPANKLLVALAFSNGTNQTISKYRAQAAAAVGWDYKFIPVAATAEGIQQAFQSALALQPAPTVIDVQGYDTSTYLPQLAEAKSRGIGVIAESTATTGNGIIARLNNDAELMDQGKILAAYVVSDSNGKADVAEFTTPAASLLSYLVTGFKAGLAQWCPACSVKVFNQQLTDIGTKTPQAVVSAIQADPKINYAIFSFGDMTAGVANALTAAGLTGKVKIAGGAADTPNVKAVTDGTESAWMSFNAPILGYRAVDDALRFVEGITPPTTNLPNQLITSANVGSLVNTSDGDYVGIADFAAQFKKLWLVG
jgi:ribose transport system substrate-binding protein